jgi:hypothetical protein
MQNMHEEHPIYYIVASCSSIQMFWFGGMKLRHFIASYLRGSTLFECNLSAAVAQFVYQRGIRLLVFGKTARCHLR